MLSYPPVWYGLAHVLYDTTITVVPFSMIRARAINMSFLTLTLGFTNPRKNIDPGEKGLHIYWKTHVFSWQGTGSGPSPVLDTFGGCAVAVRRCRITHPRSLKPSLDRRCNRVCNRQCATVSVIFFTCYPKERPLLAVLRDH